MAFSVKGVNLKGCLFGAPSPKDFRTVFKDQSIPDKVDLRPYCTPVEDQREIGSCTANAAVGAMEYLYKVREGKSPDLSRLFVYYNARRIRGTISTDTGAQINDAMASVLAFGACLEEMWPYDPKSFTKEPDSRAYENAVLHEAIQYSRVDGVAGSVAALAARFPVVFGTTIPGRCYEEAAKSGVMPVPTDSEITTNQGGGHCMLMVGYDKPERMFIVRNSWGESWGDRGYAKIPFDVIDACSPRDCFWIIGELARPGNFMVIRPGRDTATAPAAAPGDQKPSGLAEKAASMRDDIRSSLESKMAASSRRVDELVSGKAGEKKVPGKPTFGETQTCPGCFGGRTSPFGGPCGTCGGSGYIGSY